MADLPRPQTDDPAEIRRTLNLMIDMIQRCQGLIPTYVTATKPAATAVAPGTIIYVSNGGAGAVFQGSNGAAWVNLG